MSCGVKYLLYFTVGLESIYDHHSFTVIQQDFEDHFMRVDCT